MKGKAMQGSTSGVSVHEGGPDLFKARLKVGLLCAGTDTKFIEILIETFRTSVAGPGHDFAWQGVNVKLLSSILEANLSLTILLELREPPPAVKTTER